jgi:hypothetical protein
VVDLLTPLFTNCSYRMGYRRRPLLQRAPIRQVHAGSWERAPPQPDACTWDPPTMQTACTAAAGADKRAAPQLDADQRPPKRQHIAATTNATSADAARQTLQALPAAPHSVQHTQHRRGSGSRAVASQLGMLSGQSGAAPSSQQRGSVQQRPAHQLSTMASADADARAGFSTGSQAQHGSVCVVDPRASISGATTSAPAALPPVPKPAGHKQAFGSEHELMDLMRCHGSFAAKFMEGCYTQPTCRAELLLLPHVDFAAPSADAQEYLATTVVPDDMPLVALQQQVM